MNTLNLNYLLDVATAHFMKLLVDFKNASQVAAVDENEFAHLPSSLRIIFCKKESANSASGLRND